MARRSKNQPRRRHLLEERAWGRVSDPATLGTILMVSGALLIAAPWGELPPSPSHAWWSTALAFPEPARASAVMVAFALVVGLGVLLGVARGRANRNTRVSAVGVALMALGVAGGLSAWFQGHRHLPVSRVSLPINQRIESYPAVSVGRAFKVMLPNRVKVTSIDLANRVAVVNVSTAADLDGEDRTVKAGNELDLGGFRWALMGVEHDPRIPRVVLASSKPNTIKASGSRGQKVQFVVDGPEFEIVRISANYLGAVGQAVELKSEEHGLFWVFTDPNAATTTPEGIWLERMESAPVAVFAVSTDEGNSWFGASFFLLMLGLLVFVLAPTRSRERGRGSEEEE